MIKLNSEALRQIRTTHLVARARCKILFSEIRVWIVDRAAIGANTSGTVFSDETLLTAAACRAYRRRRKVVT